MGGSDAIFQGIQKAVEADGEALVKKMKAIFCFKIKDGSTWLVNLKDGKGSITKGEGKADCTITIGDADLVAMASGTDLPHLVLAPSLIKFELTCIMSKQHSFPRDHHMLAFFVDHRKPIR
ncbi:unnamed protein product [Amoebophrya sp. A25]|nr:unnamed protein product [Amoebophrya sp. A25]|eukprot:GSA25T00011165001.1